MNYRQKLVCGVALGALLSGAGQLLAADFTVVNGQVVTTTQTLTDAGDAGLIEAGGTVSVNGIGVESSGDNQSVRNNGAIETSGVSGSGIYSSGADVVITNSGSISTSLGAAIGIYSSGSDAVITNSGTIETSGYHGYGIYSTDVDTVITNSGSITTSGDFGWGIEFTGSDAVIVNNGSISTSGDNAYTIGFSGSNAQIVNSGSLSTSGDTAYAIIFHGDNAQIVNSGNITTSGETGTGIYAAGADAVITNNGTISASGAHAEGIYSLADDATVTNSGTIISQQSAALWFAGAGATLNLLAGSVIQGDIVFSNGAAASATLNIRSGQNLALTFTGLPGTINTYGAPSVVSGSQLIILDPAGFAAQDAMLAGLTGAIVGSIDGRLADMRRTADVPTGAILPLGYAASPVLMTEASAATAALLTAEPAGSFWASGLGSHRSQRADGAQSEAGTNLGGVMIGYDAEMESGMRAGAFLGASVSRFKTDSGSQQIDADSYFGGLYADFTAGGSFIDLAVTGGLTRQSSERAIANNLVAGGIDYASADYDGLFISPSATLGTAVALANGASLIPSLRARYAGMFLDGYEESGSAADLSVDSRNLHVFDLRAQLAYALETKEASDGALNAMLRIGGDASFANNGNVQASVLGNSLNISTGCGNTLGGFVGADFDFETKSGTNYFFTAELGYDNSKAVTLDLRSGLKMAF